LQTKLWCTIDKWGLMRGSKDLVWRQGTSRAPSAADEASVETETMTVDRPDWRWNLHPHWDWNPWVYQAMVDRGLPRMYQGIIALDDCPEEVGGHITIPGSAAYLPHWVPITTLQTTSHSSSRFGFSLGCARAGHRTQDAAPALEAGAGPRERRAAALHTTRSDEARRLGSAQVMDSSS
jgi:hypothetical protein